MQPLTPDTSFHIFNHANGFENVFRQADNFRYFLKKYRLHISPIAETYAYCLMPNHFHLVVRIRKREVIAALIRNKNNNFSKVSRLERSVKASQNEVEKNNFSKVSSVERSVKVSQNEYDQTTSVNFGKVNNDISDSEIEKFLSKQFANLFSSYTQSFNKVYHRMGSLFIKNFKRTPILEKDYFLNAIVYTHRNPIHHKFCKNYDEWDFSSYNEIVGGVCDHIAISKLLKITGGLDSFKELHLRSLENFDNRFDLEIP